MNYDISDEYLMEILRVNFSSQPFQVSDVFFNCLRNGIGIDDRRLEEFFEREFKHLGDGYYSF